MAIQLNKIPEKKVLPEPPSMVRWIIIVAFIMVLGILVSLYFWPSGISTHSAWFWFCTFLIPFFSGAILYASRLRYYENERDRVFHWNQLYQTEYDAHVELGQRSIAVLGTSYITPVGSNKLISAVQKVGSPLQTQYYTHLQQSLTTAQLKPLLEEFTVSEYQTRLKENLEQLLKGIQLDSFGLQDSISIRIRHDGIIDNSMLLAIWQELFPVSIAVSKVEVLTTDDGLMWIDTWLDKNDVSLVLSVEINLFQNPREKETESVSALLLASSDWLKKNSVQPKAIIHRPVVVKNKNDLADVARWGLFEPGESFSLWRTQVESQKLAELLMMMDEGKYLQEMDGDNFLDDLMGRPGTSVGNVALICASEQAAERKHVQWIVATDETTHLAIVRPV